MRDAISITPLTLREIATRNFHLACYIELYNLVNVLIDDMTSKEILAVTLETVARVNGFWTPPKQYLKSEESLRNIFQSIPELRMRPDIDKVPTGKLAACFLEGYPNFLD